MPSFSLLRLSFLSLAFVGALSVTHAFWPFDGGNKDGTPSSTKINVNQTQLDRSDKFITSFAPIVKKVGPSVVSLSATRLVSERSAPLPSNNPLFRRFWGNPDEEEGGEAPPGGRPSHPRQQKETGIGSGVIVSEDGFILTSNHVIEGAKEIKVTFATGDSVKARLIGSDPKTDIAVLKVEKKNLPAITFGDSDQLEVGDVVLAIGNPFNLSKTVTMGIVSAMGRNDLKILGEGYENFIQTDASINPGNSGGALTDSQGRLVGLNTAIYSESGGNQGIGFAVPINLARSIMDQILSKGRVIRGYLGVGIQDMDEDMAKEFNMETTQGALVGDVKPDGPAKEAGIQPGDVIIKLNDEAVSSPSQLRLKISQTSPGTKIKITVLRGKKQMDFTLTLKELPDAAADLGDKPDRAEQSPVDSILEGIKIGDLEDRIRHQLNIPNTIQGAVVQDVDGTLPAVVEGKIRPGDVILEVNRKVVKNAAEAIREAKKTKGDNLVLRLWRKGAAFYSLLPLKDEQE